jgi:hypothetical protein
MEFDPAGAIANPPKAKKQSTLWEWDTKKGTMSEKDKRLAVLAFAGIRSAKIAEIMSAEFGRKVSKCAIDNKIFRLEIIREKNDLIDSFDPEKVEELARRRQQELKAELRFCYGLKRPFFRYRTRGGSYFYCREFEKAKKYENARRNRDSQDRGM